MTRTQYVSSAAFSCDQCNDYDIVRLPEVKMADRKPDIGLNFIAGIQNDIGKIPTHN